MHAFVSFGLLALCISFGKSEKHLTSNDVYENYEHLVKSLTENIKTPSDLLESDFLGNPEVNTENGTIIGVTYTESHAFYSIPYAQPPIDDLRFRPPKKAITPEMFNASRANYVKCYEFQTGENLEENKELYSEDCLVLNINVPSTIDLSSSPSERLPVMFWIHGGAFFAGAGTSRFYDSRVLSNVTNTIVVTINYRLGPFGFLVYDDEEDSFEGNQGLKDQQLALEWVRDNIQYFGGDKDMITIFGQSAGAQSTTLHLMSEKSKPLFKRAILESSPAAYYYPKKREAKMKAQALLDNLDCNSTSPVQCLKTLPPEELISAHKRVAISLPFNIFNIIEPYRPVIDDEFQEQPLTYFQSGKWQDKKEVMMGFNSGEIDIILYWIQNMRFNFYQIATNFVFGTDLGPVVMNEYSKFVDQDDPIFNYNKIFAQQLSDMMFVCPNLLLGKFISASFSTEIKTPTLYSYVNSHPLDGPQCTNRTYICGYAFHGAELPFVFRNGPLYGYTYSEDGLKVSNMFNSFFGNFVYNGIPTDDLSEWPYYTENEISEAETNSWSNIRIQGPESFVESEYSKDICQFWDNLGFYIDPIQKPTTQPTDGSTLSPSDETSRETTLVSVEETTLESAAEQTTTGSSAPLTLNNFMFVFLIAANILFT